MSALSLFGDDEVAPDPPVPMPRPANGSEPPPPQSLYRKYRPQSFDDDDLVGQEHIVRTIRNALRLDRVAHAYLFCGPRGTGKTTTARLLAKAVNCLDPDPDRRPCNRCDACVAINRGAATDIVEIDAASNRGIDDIRDLRERVKYAPTQLRSKFYIVDEAHQITGAAANAFLKTLEEPPLHTRFVLATTDPEELLPTIVSRCQRFDFRRIGYDAMAGRLRVVAEREAIPIDDEALREIVRHATGSLRDALGLLDQLALHGGGSTDNAPIGAEAVRALLGISRNERVDALLEALGARDAAKALIAVNEAVEAGEDPRQLNRQLVAALRSRLHALAGGRSSRQEAASTNGQAPALDLARVAELLRRFSEVDYKIRHSPYAHLPLEIALVESIVAPPIARDDLSSAPSVAPRPAITPPRQPMAEEATAGPEQMPSTRLRDRVRGTSSSPAAPQARPPSTSSALNGPANGGTDQQPPPNAGRPNPQPPAWRDGEREDEPAAPAQPAATRTLSVEHLADLWPRIRQDVKALNRRVEALLSSFDPARVAGDRILLATPYEFHRDKLNSDDVRPIVEQVVGRLVGRSVSVAAVLVGDLGQPQSQPQPQTPPAPASLRVVEQDEAPEPVSPKAAPGGDEIIPDEVHDQRVQSAKNIFDAEEETDS